MVLSQGFRNHLNSKEKLWMKPVIKRNNETIYILWKMIVWKNLKSDIEFISWKFVIFLLWFRNQAEGIHHLFYLCCCFIIINGFGPVSTLGRFLEKLLLVRSCVMWNGFIALDIRFGSYFLLGY